MSIIWFNSVLEAIGKKINYEAVSGLYGNSFAKDVSDIVSSVNPLKKHEQKNNMAALFASGVATATTVKTITNKAEMEAELGDISWAN